MVADGRSEKDTPANDLRRVGSTSPGADESSRSSTLPLPSIDEPDDLAYIDAEEHRKDYLALGKQLEIVMDQCRDFARDPAEIHTGDDYYPTLREFHRTARFILRRMRGK